LITIVTLDPNLQNRAREWLRFAADGDDDDSKKEEEDHDDAAWWKLIGTCLENFNESLTHFGAIEDRVNQERTYDELNAWICRNHFVTLFLVPAFVLFASQLVSVPKKCEILSGIEIKSIRQHYVALPN
jgi:hypothetical protein